MHTFICDNKKTVVQTDKGLVKGYFYDHTYVFQGIPYAKAKRFHAPEQVDAWEGIFDATSYGYVCPLMELGKPSGELKTPHRYWVMNEDCQNLNIWTPALDDKKRPVMVWFHGGGFEAGSSIEQVAYDGANMAYLGDVVVVSINHRLNILGYLDVSDFGEEYKNSGNNGTNDIIASLQWVQKNIENFGGDPSNVTIFGQSGGGTKVTTLLQSTNADGLYHKGIVMSGVIDGILPDSVGSGKEIVEEMMKELNLTSIKELELVDYQKMVDVYKKLKPKYQAQNKYVGCTPQLNDIYKGNPNIHGFREETKDIPLIIGSNFGEFLPFFPTPYDRNTITDEEAMAIIGQTFKDDTDTIVSLFKETYPDRKLIDVLQMDTVFRLCNSQYNLNRGKVNPTHTFNYIFNQDFIIDGGCAPWHCSDIPYFFHNCELVPVCQETGVVEDLEDHIFKAVMAFARTGNPNHEGIPEWPSTDGKDEYNMLLQKEWKVVKNHDHAIEPILAKIMLPMIIALFTGNKDAVQH